VPRSFLPKRRDLGLSAEPPSGHLPPLSSRAGTRSSRNDGLESYQESFGSSPAAPLTVRFCRPASGRRLRNTLALRHPAAVVTRSHGEAPSNKEHGRRLWRARHNKTPLFWGWRPGGWLCGSGAFTPFQGEPARSVTLPEDSQPGTCAPFLARPNPHQPPELVCLHSRLRIQKWSLRILPDGRGPGTGEYDAGLPA